MKTNFNIDWIREKPVAHRGLHHNPDIPENSLLSFKKAIEKGNPIELDLQLTSDGKVVCFHDDDLKRVCGDDRVTWEVPFNELIEMKLFNTDEKIPSFKNVLELVNGQVPLLIEVKNRNYTGALEDAIFNELKDYDGEYAIQSFNPFTVAHFKRLNPAIPRGMISGTGKDFALPAWKTFVLRNLLLAPYVKPHFINYEAEGLQLPSISFIRKFTDIPILGWTIDDQEKFNQFKNQCDNVIFEKVDLGSV